MQLAQILLGCCESQATAQFVSRSQSLLLACDGLFGGGMGWMGPRGTQVLFTAICHFFLIYCQWATSIQILERLKIIRFFLILVQLIGLFGFGIGSSCFVIMSCYSFKHERLCMVSIDSSDSSIIFTVVIFGRICMGLLVIMLA